MAKAKKPTKAEINRLHKEALEINANMNSGRNYFNKTKRNIFTENGRVMPGETILLTPEQAVIYTGLEECQK